MQQAFCTNCGQPLVAGTAFCGNCGAPATPAGLSQPPAYTPGTGQPPVYTPGGLPAAPVATATRRRGFSWAVGCAGGCLLLFLLFVVGIIGSLVYGIVNREVPFIAVGLAGIAVALLAVNFIRHLIRRHLRPRIGGALGWQATGTPYRRPIEQARPHPSHFGFFFLLLALAAGLFFGLPYYYTNLFSGSWSGTLTSGSSEQGVFLTLGVTVPSILSHEPSGVAVQFNKTPAQVCHKGGSQETYTVIGTASNFDVSSITLTFTTSKGTTFTLQGSFHSNTFSLSGSNGGTPLSLMLQKGSQADYTATCKGLGLAGG